MDLDDNTRTIHQVAASILRQQDRAKKALSTRLKEATGRAVLLSTIASQQSSEAGYTTQGKTGSKPPPDAHQFNVEAYLAPIRHHVERLEDAIDAEQGLSASKHHATKTGEELDQEILAWVGVEAHVVATKAPHLGSPRTIERVRSRAGLRPSDGRERQPKAA